MHVKMLISHSVFWSLKCGVLCAYAQNLKEDNHQYASLRGSVEGVQSNEKPELRSDCIDYWLNVCSLR